MATPQTLMSALSSFNLGAFANAVSLKPAAQRDELSDVEAERQVMTELKTHTWDLARSRANERGDAMPTMTDYLVAAHSPEIRASVAASSPSVQWTGASMVNFDGMTLSNAQLNAADFDHRNLTAGDREALSMTDDVIGELYNDVINNMVCHSFTECRFHPADTINHYLGDKEAVVKNCDFNGMQAGDTLKLQFGSYEGITFTDIAGGRIEVADGTQVTGMDISGAHAELIVGKASLQNVNATGACLVRFDAAPGAHISHMKLNGTTVSLASKMTGVTLSDVECTNASLHDVDLSHATLNRVSFQDTQLSGLDLSDAQIINMTINGDPVNDVHQLAAMGVTVSEHTTVETRAERGQEAHVEAALVPEDHLQNAAVRDPQYGRGADAQSALDHAFSKEGNIADIVASLQQNVAKGEFAIPELSARRADPAAQQNLATLLDRPIAIRGGEEVSHTDGFSPGQALAEMAKPEHLIREGGMTPGQSGDRG